jgi:hypothetical protein
MKEYPVLKPLVHDQKDYAPGSTVELEDHNATYLLGQGVIAKPEKQPAKNTPAGKE